MRVGSLFTGIGGFDLGFERAGMEIAWQSEIDSACNKVLKQHWPDVANIGAIERTGISQGRRLFQFHLGNGQLLTPSSVDLLCGGFPCQDVSVAGNRGGLKSERSGLFFEFLRIAYELQPKWIVIENVPGLLSSNEGKDFHTVLESLAQIGYTDLSWRVLDSLGFGVPQRRRRLFIVGCLGTGTRSRQVLLESEGREWRAPSSRETREGVAAPTQNGAGTCGTDEPRGRVGHLIASIITPKQGEFNFRGDGSDNLVMAHETGHSKWKEAEHSGTLTARDYKSPTQVVASFRKSKRAQTNTDDESREPGTYANTLNPFDVGDTRTVQIIVEYDVPPYVTQDAVGITTKGNGEAFESEYIPPLAGGGGMPGTRVRRLIPVECERLQGFPDGWTETVNDSARYKCLGNAVTVPVAEWIGNRIMEVEYQRAPTFVWVEVPV